MKFMNIISRQPGLNLLLSLALIGVLCPPALAAPLAQSQWVSVNPAGKLSCQPLPAGDRIMDFSQAGYLGGGVKIPTVPVKRTVAPSGGDDTDAIQAALNEVSQLELQDGFRGAVLLSPGVFHGSRTLTIKAGGVVLRGSGCGADGTTLQMIGDPHLCLSIGGGGAPVPVGQPVAFTDSYVPSGADSFDVSSAENFHPGDPVLINRPATTAWVAFMGMNTLVRNGKPQHWVSGEMHAERTVKRVAGNRVTLDIPLSDSFDSKYLNPPGGSLVKCDLSARPTRIGVEDFRLVSPPQAVTIVQRHNQALRMDGVSDAWVRDLNVENTVNSFYFGEHTSRLTIDRVDIRHEAATLGAAKPEDFWAGGTQTLINRCSATGNNLFYFSTGARMMGPVVVLNCVFHGDGHIQPHMRWGTGLLLDNCQVPESGIDLMDRGVMGSGHGWTIGWSVAWNCTAKTFVIQQPPGSMNWAIGCRGAFETSAEPGRKNGPKLPAGMIDSPDVPVAPASLYLAQLRERLGPPALANIGY
jgi:hypothetical protein